MNKLFKIIQIQYNVYTVDFIKYIYAYTSYTNVTTLNLKK